MSNFFKFFCWLFLFPLFGLRAEAHLDHLAEYDAQTCQEVLQAVDLPTLWNCYLKGQTDLYFEQEAEWLSQKDSWTRAQNILELGSGNGTYLSRLSETFKEKTFFGVEKQASFVEQSNAQFSRSGLTFIEGDAETEYEQHRNQFDAVLYRFTLQHLKNPKLSLELAHQYLKKDGYIFIIDSYDPARISSHKIHSFEDASHQHNERNRAASKGNRRITIEILEDLQAGNSSLSNLYEVAHTSLDIQGNRLEKGIRFESEQDRKRYFNHALLFLSILKKGYEVSVDLSKAYNELQVYLEDKTAWNCPGMHLLILRKI
ncbi:MAG: methyltransferase domain-containing protein [Chlamydiia bacterium]|nr:methyltransferase domain-containing protein [Chlamydiia bacterium]